jgi:benzoylformate decarboxylase
VSGAAAERHAGARPEPALIARAAELLAGALAPVVIVGDGVARSGAVSPMTVLAEDLGARVYGEPIYRRTNFPGDHPLWRGGLAPTPDGVRKAVEEADVLLIVGADVFTWFLPGTGSPLPPGLVTIQVADDPRQLGRSYPVSLAIWADPGSTIVELLRAVRGRLGEVQTAAAAERRASLSLLRDAFVTRVGAAAEAEADRAPISPAYLMHTLAQVLPEDAVIVDESASCLPHVLRHLPFRHPGSFFGSKTGTLGWAAGAAIGVQLACPRRKVVVTIGDGSLMYAPQALWTAARYQLPITYVVPNNAAYAILKAGLTTLGLESTRRGIDADLELVNPEIDYLRLAGALGVRAERVDTPGDLKPLLSECLAHAGPTLVDLALERDRPGAG